MRGTEVCSTVAHDGPEPRRPTAGVLDGFRSAARYHGDRPAIVDNGQALSYAQLAERAAAVARRLGARPGVVGVAATHGAATVAALLGVWSAGGAYCPVDPAFPPPRRHTMLTAAGCRCLLDPRTASMSRMPDGPDSDADCDTGYDGGIGYDSDGLAYTLFTSGSTGEPRPVLTPHRAIDAVTAALRELFAIRPADRVLQFASLNWDTCFEEILPTLTAGACLVFHPDAYTGSFPRFLRMVQRERISVLDLPTAFWHELVTHLVDEGAPLPACVRLVIIGGEAASPARLADWRNLRTGHARLLNTYGCTETTLITHAIDLHGPAMSSATGSAGESASSVMCSSAGESASSVMCSSAGGSASSDARVPIGWALPHVVEHVTEAGELLIGGPGLADGYRGGPEPTRARFVTVNGQRFFRTGDRVSRRSDGALVHEGRLDSQIKIRGIRVDPSEVETHIAVHPGVSAVAVIGVPMADHTVLAAFVVARPHVSTTGLDASILDHLRGRLPAHLIPTRIRVVTELVYTASGKVDRRRIKEALA